MSDMPQLALAPITVAMYRAARAKLPGCSEPITQRLYQTQAAHAGDLARIRQTFVTGHQPPQARVLHLRLVDVLWEPMFQASSVVGWHCLNPIVAQDYLP